MSPISIKTVVTLLSCSGLAYLDLPHALKVGPGAEDPLAAPYQPLEEVAPNPILKLLKSAVKTVTKSCSPVIQILLCLSLLLLCSESGNLKLVGGGSAHHLLDLANNSDTTGVSSLQTPLLRLRGANITGLSPLELSLTEHPGSSGSSIEAHACRIAFRKLMKPMFLAAVGLLWSVKAVVLGDIDPCACCFVVLLVVMVVVVV